MKEFMFLFRQQSYDAKAISPEEMQQIAKRWQNWVEGIASQGKFVSHGNRLSTEGKVLKPGGVVTDGPFVEIREILGGFMVVKADSLDEATTLAHGCPALDYKGSVEVRPFYE
ncbi:YciI family protein [Gaoshiqia sp. Z1-71]|uniref:YciI family protein n=1 Tax=Gaoshiqia hydrogeniformans TaxID=3290090 RepID=UPI003BF8E60D